MIVLNTANRSLQYLLGGVVTANQLPFVVGYVNTTREGQNHPNSANGTSNNATAVTILAAPNAGEKRTIQFLTIRNADTVDATVTIRFNDNATLRDMPVVVLNTGDTLIYTTASGWFVLSSAGYIKSTSTSNAATQGQLETGTDVTVFTSPGRQQFHPSAAKGWIRAQYDAVNLASYNVTSITDTGIGDLTVNWNVDFSSTNYSPVVTVINDNAQFANVANTNTVADATRVRTFTDAGTLVDGTTFSCIAFGDQ